MWHVTNIVYELYVVYLPMAGMYDLCGISKLLLMTVLVTCGILFFYHVLVIFPSGFYCR